MVKNKPKGLLMKQRNSFLNFCPICGKRPLYLQRTNILVCDHKNTEFESKEQYYRLLNKRGEEIARDLFGEGR